MEKVHFSEEDVMLMIRALDSLREYNLPEYLDAQTEQLQLRIANHLPKFTDGELRNVCLGLEKLISENPLEWKASALLSRLQSLVGPSDPRKKRK